jgi:hypothetical protein
VILWYTESFTNIFGQQSIVAQHGMIHKYLKNLILHLVGPENLKANIVHELDEFIRRHLRSWATHATVDLKEVASNVNIYIYIYIYISVFNLVSFLMTQGFPMVDFFFF